MSISRSGSVQRTPTLHGESDGGFFFEKTIEPDATEELPLRTSLSK